MKHLVMIAVTMMLSGCFLTHAQVEHATKKCTALGGIPLAEVNGARKALNVYCEIGRIRYSYVNGEF